MDDISVSHPPPSAPSSPQSTSSLTSDQNRHRPLLTLLSQSEISIPYSSTPTDPPSLYSPIPHPSLTNSISHFLSLLPDSFTISSLYTAVPFLSLASLPDLEKLQLRVESFKAYALKNLSLEPSCIPTIPDFLYHRNPPRLLFCFAVLASYTHPILWSQTSPPPLTSWSSLTLTHPYSPSALLPRLAALVPSDLRLAVVGTQGSGKSAWIAATAGIELIGQSHPLSFYEEDDEDEKLWTDIRGATWPWMPMVFREALGAQHVDEGWIKTENGVVGFIELPSMQNRVEYGDEMGLRMSMNWGEWDSTVKEMEGRDADFVMVVERMDDIRENELLELLKKVKKLWGKDVMGRVMIILTHGQERTPKGVRYEKWKWQHEFEVKLIAKRAGLGDVPVVVVENSDQCRTENGVKVLPDGTPFEEDLVTSFQGLVRGTDLGKPLQVVNTKPWWENAATIFGAALLLVRLL